MADPQRAKLIGMEPGDATPAQPPPSIDNAAPAHAPTAPQNMFPTNPRSQQYHREFERYENVSDFSIQEPGLKRDGVLTTGKKTIGALYLHPTSIDLKTVPPQTPSPVLTWSPTFVSCKILSHTELKSLMIAVTTKIRGHHTNVTPSLLYFYYHGVQVHPQNTAIQLGIDNGEKLEVEVLFGNELTRMSEAGTILGADSL